MKGPGIGGLPAGFFKPAPETGVGGLPTAFFKDAPAPGVGGLPTAFFQPSQQAPAQTGGGSTYDPVAGLGGIRSPMAAVQQATGMSPKDKVSLALQAYRGLFPQQGGMGGGMNALGQAGLLLAGMMKPKAGLMGPPSAGM